MNYRFATVFFICLLAVTIAIICGLTMRHDGVGNPFTPYADLMPGYPQPTSGEGFQCESAFEYTYAPRGTFYCVRYREALPIRWISVSGIDGRISHTSFGVVLRYGDIVALYGRAETIGINWYSSSMRWRGVVTYGSGRRRDASVSMLTGIRYVAFFIPAERNR